jgi:hypothetical protein
LAIICLVLILAAIGQETGDARGDPAGLRICVWPNQKGIEGDISPGNLKYYSIAKKETDDKEKYAAFLNRSLPRLQGHDVDTEPDFYVTFSVYFERNKPSGKQLASAIICKKKFGSMDNVCRNRTYLSFSYYEPEVLAEVIVDDILKYEPLITRCPSAN